MTNNTNRAAEAAQPAATSGDAPTDGWPSEIYLNAGDDPLGHFDEYADVSWCDHPQGENDVRYVRAELARIERTTAHVQPVNTSSERVENAAGNEQVERAAAPAPTAPFAWMKSNEIDGLLDAADKTTHQGEPVRQYGRIYARQYDADMVPVYAASPATASGDELESFGNYFAGTLSCDDSENADLISACRSAAHDAWMERARRAAVSAATKPTADLSKLTRYCMKAVGMSVVDMKADPSGEFVKFADVQSLLATKPAGDQSATIIEILQARIKRMEEQQNAHRPDFLLNGTRFKLNFSARGNVDVFHNYASELQGRWVALVPAEDDMHLAPTAAPADQVRNAARYEYLVSQYPSNIADALDCGIREIGEEIDEAIEEDKRRRAATQNTEGAK